MQPALRLASPHQRHTHWPLHPIVWPRILDQPLSAKLELQTGIISIHLQNCAECPSICCSGCSRVRVALGGLEKRTVHRRVRFVENMVLGLERQCAKSNLYSEICLYR